MLSCVYDRLSSILKTRNVLKLTCFIIFGIVCFAQCYVIIRNYFQAPVTIDMYDVSPNLITILPGITFCNNNRLSLRKLLTRNSTLRRAFNNRFVGEDFKKVKPKMGSDGLRNYRDGILKIYDEFHFDAQAKMDGMTMNESYASKPDSLLRWVGCARTWTNSIECNYLTQIESIQDRKCDTILHKGSLLYDQTQRPHLFNSSTILDTGLYNYFDAKEVIKVLVDFDPEDYADLKRQIGARVIFHPADHVGTSVDRDFFLTRGYRYDFHLSREDIMLNGGKEIACFDYSSNLDLYRDNLNPRVPLYGDTCLHNCVTRNIIYKANCWPTTMPYFRNDSFDPTLQLKSCSWLREPQYFTIFKEILRIEHMKKLLAQGINVTESEHFKNKSRSLRAGMRLYTRIRRFCWSQCMIACRVTEYKISVTRSEWPSDVEISLNKTGNEEQFKHCCALITVKYSHFHYDIQQFLPKYNLIDTIGNMGGLLAVWLGISFVSVYNALQRLVELYQRRIGMASSKVHDVSSSHGHSSTGA